MHIQRHRGACVVNSVLREDISALPKSVWLNMKKKTWLEPAEVNAHDANLGEKRSNRRLSIVSARLRGATDPPVLQTSHIKHSRGSSVSSS